MTSQGGNHGVVKENFIEASQYSGGINKTKQLSNI